MAVHVRGGPGVSDVRQSWYFSQTWMMRFFVAPRASFLEPMLCAVGAYAT